MASRRSWTVSTNVELEIKVRTNNDAASIQNYFFKEQPGKVSKDEVLLSLIKLHRILVFMKMLQTIRYFEFSNHLNVFSKDYSTSLQTADQ